jgi:ABC-2 type transport system ATP-binding protein
LDRRRDLRARRDVLFSDPRKAGAAVVRRGRRRARDDFSMGLDPGYRQLFIEVIRDFAADGQRSILLTSHIIQDLETLVDDVIIYQQGKVLLDTSMESLARKYRRFTFRSTSTIADEFDDTSLVRVEPGMKRASIFGFVDAAEASALLAARGIDSDDLRQEPLSLEDAFIALNGKY